VQVGSIVILDDGSPAVYGTGEGAIFAKFSPTGAFEWRHTHFELFADVGTKMVRDRISGNYIIAGRCLPAGKGAGDAFVGGIQQSDEGSSACGRTPAFKLVVQLLPTLFRILSGTFL
jgi:hypothetical protein